MKLNGSLCLASSSPRRLGLLRDAGIEVDVCPPDIDDGLLRSGSVQPEQWVMSLAFLKARRVHDQLLRDGNDTQRVILAADTICTHDGRVFGQPRDASHARTMLEALRNSEHQTWSGVCLLDLLTQQRMLISDVATVRIGALSEDEIDRYIDSGDWAGKAGAYNYIERLEDGWPLECEGDPTTVMGLPMRQLPAWIERFKHLCSNAA